MPSRLLYDVFSLCPSKLVNDFYEQLWNAILQRWTSRQLERAHPRSLETYFTGANGFADVYKNVRDDLTPLRNDVVHRGHLAYQEQAKRAIQIAGEFLKIVNLTICL